MKVFVTGGTGFVGSYILRSLVKKGDSLIALVRKGSKPKLAVNSVDVVYGDVMNPKELPKAMEGADAVISLVGIIREYRSKGITFYQTHYDGTRHVVDAARKVGIKRFIHMSSNGAGINANTPYQTSKWAAEEYVKASGLEWTIFRPSIIFGNPYGNTEFATQLAEIVRKAPIVPIFGDGKYQMQPVAVEDVAIAFSNAITISETIEKTYQLCGSKRLTYIELLNEIGKAIGKDKIKTLPMPLVLIKPIVKTFDRFSFFPITYTQLTMLIDGNICHDQNAWTELNIEPKGFEAANLSYLAVV
jgi:uncharacterized protein YbjT (DUF2867 family)